MDPATARASQVGRAASAVGRSGAGGTRLLASRIRRKTRENPTTPDRAETRNNPRKDEAPRSRAMVVRRLGGAGCALLTLPNIRRRASNSWAAVRDTFFSTKVLTDDLAASLMSLHLL